MRNPLDIYVEEGKIKYELLQEYLGVLVVTLNDCFKVGATFSYLGAPTEIYKLWVAADERFGESHFFEIGWLSKASILREPPFHDKKNRQIFLRWALLDYTANNRGSSQTKGKAVRTARGEIPCSFSVSHQLTSSPPSPFPLQKTIATSS